MYAAEAASAGATNAWLEILPKPERRVSHEAALDALDAARAELAGEADD